MYILPPGWDIVIMRDASSELHIIEFDYEKKTNDLLFESNSVWINDNLGNKVMVFQMSMSFKPIWICMIVCEK